MALRLYDLVCRYRDCCFLVKDQLIEMQVPCQVGHTVRKPGEHEMQRRGRMRVAPAQKIFRNTPPGKFLVEGIHFLVEGNRFLVEGNQFLVEGNRFPVEGNHFPLGGSHSVIAPKALATAARRFRKIAKDFAEMRNAGAP